MTDRVRRLDAIINCPKNFPNNKKEEVVEVFESAEKIYLEYQKNPKAFSEKDRSVYPQFEKLYFDKTKQFSDYCEFKGEAAESKKENEKASSPKKIETRADAEARIKALQTILKYKPNDETATKRIKQIQTLLKYL